MSNQETQVAQGVAAPAKFISRYPDLKLWMRQPVRSVVEGVVNLDPGKAIRFVHHEYTTSDPDEQAFIRNHRFFGFDITEVLPEDLDSLRKPPSMQRVPVTTKPPQNQADQDPEDAPVKIPCGFEGCDYVAKGKDEADANKRLNAHRLGAKHFAKEPEKTE